MVGMVKGFFTTKTENPWKYHYWTCGGKTSMQGYVTLKEARWDARAKGQMVIDENGNTVLDYTD